MNPKPEKPYEGFPLFPHQCGQWAKKIRGKLCYFGVWSDPGAALAKYLDQRDDLQAGRKPRPPVEDTVFVVCDKFLQFKLSSVESGELEQRTYDEYRMACERVIRVFGRNRDPASLGPEDFQDLRSDISKTRKAVSLSTEIQRCRSIFRYAHIARLIATPVDYGIHFAKASRKTLRHARNSRPEQMVNGADIGSAIALPLIHFQAWVLLGINCGFGATDLAELRREHVDLDGAWIHFARPKTGVERDCPLWPETVAALRESIENRWKPTHCDPGLFFATRKGFPLVQYKAGRIDAVGQAWRKAMTAIGAKQAGVGFYSLRHTFRTVADEVKDAAAIKRIMGHSEDDPTDPMRAIYVERVSRDRLLAVTDHVRSWMFYGPRPVASRLR